MSKGWGITMSPEGERSSRSALPRARSSSTHPRRRPPNGGVAWMPEPLHDCAYGLAWLNQVTGIRVLGQYRVSFLVSSRSCYIAGAVPASAIFAVPLYEYWPIVNVAEDSS